MYDRDRGFAVAATATTPSAWARDVADAAIGDQIASHVPNYATSSSHLREGATSSRSIALCRREHRRHHTHRDPDDRRRQAARDVLGRTGDTRGVEQRKTADSVSTQCGVVTGLGTGHAARPGRGSGSFITPRLKRDSTRCCETAYVFLRMTGDRASA